MPSADQLLRRTMALRAKLGSLSDEVAAWTKMPEADAFAMHKSQIEVVCGGLTAMHQLLAAEIKKAEAAGAISLEEVEPFERTILAALQIWECYRSKFALRLVESLRLSLALVDDLAWQAYRPARDRAVASGAVSAVDVREPPLVFPNSRWSPFARSREQAYELDENTGDLRAFADFDQWLRTVPVPLIGIPWYQMAHLPDAVFIGHEVGHLVEEDLGLEEPLRTRIAAALADVPDERLSAWTRRWRSEVFADIYGVLTTGPAFAAVLLDVLAGEAKALAAEKQPDDTRPSEQRWSAYPTRILRALLVCEAVRQLPSDPKNPDLFSARADALQTLWTAANQPHAMESYVGDIKKVVRTILTTPFAAFATKEATGGLPLTSVFTFSAEMERAARRDAKEANGKKPATGEDVRALFAGVAQAFIDDPKRFFDAGAQERFRRQLVTKRTQGVRAVATPGFQPAAPTARHEAVATALFTRLQALSRP